MEGAKYPIVGIGASAGGIEALKHFFGGLPADTGCAFVIVTHMSPDHRSLLPEIVARFTEMPVHAAANGMNADPNNVYVLPKDAVMGIEKRVLTVRKHSSARRRRKSVDQFFASLSKDVGEYAVGVVLSGGDGDGTLGAKAIKENAGFTLAQTAGDSTPQYPDMPRSAIESGVVDAAVPAEEMGARIAEFAHSFSAMDHFEKAAHTADGQASQHESRSEICAILTSRTGHDFFGYKDKTFWRRVQRRMQVNRLDGFGPYIDLLRRDSREVDALFRDLLIKVTSFFRDAEAFGVLQKEVIPKLFANRGVADTVRIWVPACATGEEAYSIAILVREHVQHLEQAPKVQIFASDIDEAGLTVARAARYPEALLDSVPPERRKRFFHAEDGSYVVSKEVRELCIFSSHSLIRDPPFSRMDLISCRNLLIYLGPEIQKQVIPTFHYALRPGGYLFLGASENATQYGDLFTPVDKKFRVFRRGDDSVAHAHLPHIGSGVTATHFGRANHAFRGLGTIALRHAAESQVLERFAPAHVIVNRDGDVVFYSQRTGKYLEAAAGTPSRQLLGMARKGLRLELRTALREAVDSERRVERENVAVETEDGRIQLVQLTIDPIVERSDAERLFLVVFSDIGAPLDKEDAASKLAPPPKNHKRSSSDDMVQQLDRELRETRERLQTMVEQYETALEELKSSNEELVSVNEELQSTNEELEASKEELQSVNEELHSVNSELNGKIEMLDRTNSDLTNLFESTRAATVFLDRDLVIRSYTPAMSQIFNIRPGDRGRPLTDLASRFSLPTLDADVRQVFITGESLERSVTPVPHGMQFQLRIVPYRDQDERIGGVVLSFVDITSLARAEEHQRKLIAELNHRVKNMLAIVIGIAEQTYRSSGDPKTFKSRFVERIKGMVRSYELLSRENWRPAQMSDLVRQQLEPFGMDRVASNGPEVRLSPRQALSLGMILHELATNAAKYGALSAEKGRVHATWTAKNTKNGGAGVEFRWLERDGPRPKEPEAEGFGLKLIREEARHALGGSVQSAFKRDGLEVALKFKIEAADGDT
ncbi:MAG: PAS domain-containing protein [Alphaproteobacteria bacterium]|nr:PAS domain-containing protein [Alphaproteobacteria bacterium]